ncbi:MAG: hypothetical protein JWO77_3094 [Ilumatobacteraceae bacterium]|nr:hypothetical protein [Ilumatobacteraceae bacterium]
MPNITIRDVPEPVHRKLIERAERSGQSLQQYLLEQLTEMTEKLTMDEWLDQAAAHRASMPPVVGVDTVALIKAGHDERDAKLADLMGARWEDDANDAGV